ncbi:MAG: SPOR domain-containing protein [Deltaproteobacteria bacterium]|nr:SPOR domain-containing protein [Deltaproteobacteria bacterium]
MAENWKERGQHLYYFSRGQLAVLAAGFTVTSVVIFFLGTLIGQGIEERKILKKSEGPLVKIPVRPQAPSSRSGPAAKEEMTFYDTLSKTGTKKAALPPKVKKKPPAPKRAEAEKVGAQTGTQESVWSVQVNAYPHERDAKGLAKKLRDKGYDAYVVPTTIKGRTWHRVRVGRFAKREEAKQLQETLNREEKFTKSFTTSR